jgi:hypothetical protein
MRKFSELFAGREGVYNVFTPEPFTQPGQKVQGETVVYRQQATQEIYDQHNAGEKSIGIVPIRIDNTVMFFMIDVDTYIDPTLHKNILKKIAANNLPLVLTKSKSGGAHLWCFLEEPMFAKDAKHVASQYVKILGLPNKTEIFPVQETVTEENLGNHISIPYFGESKKAMVLDPVTDEPKEIGLKDFLKLANSRIVHPRDISHVYEEAENVKNDVVDGGSDAPPCIDFFEKHHVDEGGRNNVVTHVGVYMKMKYPNTWEERLYDWHREYCEESLSPTEMRVICTSLEKGEFFYKCQAEPMKSVCNNELCKKRKFGVGGGAYDGDLPFTIGPSRKINSEEPVYYININGKDVRMTLDDLCSFQRVQKLYIKVGDGVLPTIKQQKWMDVLDGILQNIIIEEAPDILGETGVIMDMLANYLQFTQEEALEDAIEDRPYFDGKRAYFRSIDFINHVKGKIKGYNGVRSENIWLILRQEAQVVEEEFGPEDDRFKLWVVPWKGKPKEEYHGL